MSDTNGHAGDAGKVALHMRVSSEEQARRESIGTQEAFLTDYCKLYGFEMAGIYKDIAVSGTIPAHERPSGFEMLQQAERGAFDTVLLYKLDRIGRKLVVVVDVHDRLEEAGVAMRSATEPIDTSTPAGRLIFQMLASFAEFERATIAERVRDGVRRSLKHGKRFGAIPYGYDYTESGGWIVVEEEAARVREIFTNIAGGGTLYSEAARLNAEGIPSPGRKYRGKPRKHGDTWGHASIRNFIHQSAYIGLHVVNTKRGELKREVPAIIAPEIAEAAKARLAENKKYSGGNPKNRHLLRGLIECECCGVHYTGFPAKTRRKDKAYLYVRYACNRWREKNKRGWHHLDCPRMNAVELETLVWNDIRSFAEDPGDALDRAVEQVNERLKADGLEERHEALAKRLARTQAEKSKYVKLYAQNDLDDEELEVHIADAKNRITNLKLLVESVEADIAAKEQDVLATQNAAAWLASLRDGLDALEEDTEEAFLQRRELVKLLVDRITVGRAENGQTKIDIVYKFRPPEPEERDGADLHAVGNTLGSWDRTKIENVHPTRGYDHMARFTPHTTADIEEMLDAIGVESIDDLFSDVSPKLEGELDLPPTLSEYEALKDVEEAARENDTGLPMFLGAGAYDRIIPSSVSAMLSRGEFLTAYTPYQPEVSQGGLQVIFEFQSMISELTGLEISNASVYDGANAVVEAALMTARLTKRDPKVAVSAGLNPRYREVIETYGVEVVELPFDGTTDFSDVPGDVSGVFVQNPNFFGNIEDIGAASEAAHGADALCVAVCDPISLAVLEAPGNLGADIAVGEAQPLGMSLSFGGPYAGYMATREKFVRQLPGRITGETVDKDGKLAYVLTLRGREQDIRRARANSNICTNQALTALAATVYTALMGPEGLREVAELSASKAHYLAERFQASGFRLRYPDSPFLWEFAVEMEDAGRTNEALLDAGIIGGLDLGYGAMLVAVTEKRTKEELDAFVEVVANA